MKTAYRLLLGVAVVLPAANRLSAQEAAAPAESGHVLLLENDRMIEGDIVREGERYRIRRALGETWLPADKVVRLFASCDDAYQHLRGQANLRDIDERLRLARWCLIHGLREQGQLEAEAALALKPENPEAKRLLMALKRPANSATASEPKKEPEPPPTPAIDLTLEATGQFASRVQPILMNTCASCHAGTRGGSFKLVRTFGDGSSNHRATQHNLAAVVAQLNLASWQTSPLLIKAVSVHGEVNKSPIKSRQTPAYQMLEEWVQLAVSNLPPRETASAGVFGPSNAPPARTFAATATQPKSEIVPASLTTPEKAAAKEVEAKASDKENQTKPAPEVKCETKAKSASPADPFDPSLFNQQTQR